MARKREISMRRSRGLCRAATTDIAAAAREMFWEIERDGSDLNVVTPDAWFHFGTDRTSLVCDAWVREGGSRSSAVRQRDQLAKAVQGMAARRGRR